MAVGGADKMNRRKMQEVRLVLRLIGVRALLPLAGGQDHPWLDLCRRGAQRRRHGRQRMIGVGSAAEPDPARAGRRPRDGMSRSPRFLPKNQDGVLVEVSCRTVNAWALMRPCSELSDTTVGVLGRSLEISPVEVVALCFLTSHAECTPLSTPLFSDK